MKNIFLLLLPALFLINSCKKDGTCNCDKYENIRLAHIPDQYKPENSSDFKAYKEDGEPFIIVNLDEFNLEKVDQGLVACLELVSSDYPEQYKINCIKTILVKDVAQKCECNEKVKLHLTPIECITSPCADFIATKEDGTVMTINNWSQFKLERVEQNVTVCFSDVQIAIYPPQYTVTCIENIEPIGKCGNTDPCGKDAVYGVVVSKDNYGGACGDWYIKSTNGMLFPLNIDEYPSIKENNQEITFTYEGVGDPCNSALGVRLTCVNGKTVNAAK